MRRAVHRSDRPPAGVPHGLQAALQVVFLSGLLGAAPGGAAGLPVPPPLIGLPAAKAAELPVVPAAGGVGAAAWTIGDEIWDRPRSAEVIRTLPAVRSAVGALFATTGSSLVIRHGRGQNDGLRAEELRHWLVALAVEPGRVVLSPVAGAAVEGLPRGTLLLELAR